MTLHDIGISTTAAVIFVLIPSSLCLLCG